jgi:hypothetical protein
VKGQPQASPAIGYKDYQIVNAQTIIYLLDMIREKIPSLQACLATCRGLANTYLQTSK